MAVPAGALDSAGLPGHESPVNRDILAVLGRPGIAWWLLVLVSGSGSNLQALIDACAARHLDAEIVAVGSNKRRAFGLETQGTRIDAERLRAE